MDISIDYDRTFSADPPFFRAFISLARAYGHRPVIVTARADQQMRSDPSRHWGDEVRAAVGDVPIVFAGWDNWKADAARLAGYDIQVWVDDKPNEIAPQSLMMDRYRRANQHLHRALEGFVRGERGAECEAHQALAEEERLHIGVAT
jgi:hypothetical protein